MKLLVLLSLFGLAAAPAAQTTYTWNGANPGDWATASNWSPNGVPSAGDAVVIGSGQPVLDADVTAGPTNTARMLPPKCRRPIPALSVVRDSMPLGGEQALLQLA